MTILQPVRYPQEFQLFYVIYDQVVEDSSEIASARVSAGFRKSMKKKTKLKKTKTISIRNNSLSRISEENTDENYNSEALKMENKVNGCHVTFFCDDEKVTSDTSDISNNNKGNISQKKENTKNTHASYTSNKNDCDKNIPWDDKVKLASENMKENFLLSRFIPELIDSNKITIV